MALGAVIRVPVYAIALFVATAVVPGIELTTGSTLSSAPLIVVAFSLQHRQRDHQPIAKTIGCCSDVLTLG